MLDLRWIRDNPQALDHALARRGMKPFAAEILQRDSEWRAVQTRSEQVQAERNRLSKEIGAAKAKGLDAAAILRQVAESKDEQARLEAEAARLRALIDEVLAPLPNLPADDVPDGADETREQAGPPAWRAAAVRVSGEGSRGARRSARHDGFRPRRQAFGRRALSCCSGALARLERALAAFMLDLHTREFGYTEVSPPLLWCATRPRSAPGSCRNSPTISSAPRPASGSSRPRKCR